MDYDSALLRIREEIGEKSQLKIGDVITALYHLCGLYLVPDSFFVLLFEWYSTMRIDSHHLGDVTSHDKAKFLEIFSNDSYFIMYFNLYIDSNKYKRKHDSSKKSNSLLHLRKFLSGMVLFRVEIFPILYPIITESDIVDAIESLSMSFRYRLRAECEFKYWALMTPIDTNNAEIDAWKFRPSEHKWWDVSYQPEAWMFTTYDTEKRLEKQLQNEYLLFDD